VARGTRSGLSPERVRVANRSRVARRAWVAAYIADGLALAGSYTLRLTRTRMASRAAPAAVARSSSLTGLGR
jgi:hypothetical protein